jgi:Flp pilus assembly protein TadG
MGKMAKRTNTRRAGFWRAFKRREGGATAVEFALLLPLLMTILFAIIKFGILFGNYLQLTDGVREAGRTLAQARSSTTPFTSTTTALQTGAPGLTFNFANSGSTPPVTSVTVAGSACATDGACITRFASAVPGTSTVVLSQTYACDLQILFWDFAPNCQLTAATTELVE